MMFTQIRDNLFVGLHPREIVANGRHIPINSGNLPTTLVQEAIQSKLFCQWLTRLDKRFLAIFNSVEIESVNFVPSEKGLRALFIKLIVTLAGAEGRTYDRIVFIRGGAVGMLMILRGDQDYVVLAHEKRLPIGLWDSGGLPAGMLDGSGHFVGVAAREIQEETGITIDEKELVDMTDLVYQGQYPGIYPSAGGCDEFIRLFLYRKQMPEKEIMELEGRLCGLAQENESITLRIVPLARLVFETPDAKALCAVAMYKTLIDNGILVA